MCIRCVTTDCLQDVHTARWIVDKCLKGDLVRGRTVILVVCCGWCFHLAQTDYQLQTHNVAIVKSIAQFVVSLTNDGRVATQGSLTEALTQDEALAAEMEHGEEALESDQIDDSADVGKNSIVRSDKLTLVEETAEGRVSWASCACPYAESQFNVL
jgi:hypothetical protein